MKIDKKYLIGALVIITALIIGLWGAPISLDGYTDISEITQNPDEYINQSVKADGVLKNNSIETVDGERNFIIKDSETDDQLKVKGYTGSLNLDSLQGERIIINGKLITDNTIEPKEILTPCRDTYTSTKIMI
ncbi:cytochrome c maturation protein CcmE [Methanonatronarchaeum sp. AMET-Sl]|uniref:cytochrome c maturation protein CcmE domain-containing protein n=1 Tax=Methanonatronarchaeum sp. AMET-Sl TaxID=3037654 RepID=UPI00244E488F|nr:cytochrome c maturation protein CcmE [Methanonatronarchaeum sp. AMET-Sl]WGI16649.1 cytochrome c maturation protein CcmE [Methanonatronarchaeum sp. AMET-Sl]